MAKCLYCNAEIPEGSAFCTACGKKQVEKYKKVFTKGSMTEDEMIDQINQWFANNPRVANVSASISLKSGFGLLTNKYILDTVSVEYELFKDNNLNQYAMLNLNKFGLVGTTTDKMLEDWKKKNPGAKVVARNGGRNARGQTGSLMLGGLGASNRTQLYIIFKYNRKTGPGAPAPSN